MDSSSSSSDFYSSSSSSSSSSSDYSYPTPAPEAGVTVSGMFGWVGEAPNRQIHSYFSGSPVVIDITGLAWPNNPASPFTVVKLEVIYNDRVVGTFREDTGNSTSISFDISSALRAIWSDYDFSNEVAAATSAKKKTDEVRCILRAKRSYSLRICTEYIATDGVFTTSGGVAFTGGQCIIGSMTEMERSKVTDPAYGDLSAFEHTGLRYGDASTKPVSSPEFVGSDSITSWVDVTFDNTTSQYYADTAAQVNDTTTNHAPIVARDTIPYTDFLFVNRRGAVETCSARMLEALSIGVEAKQYARVGTPSFIPSRSIMAITSGGRRSWAMSSGHQTREWAEWWTLEFLMAERHWMWYDGAFVPVTVTPAKKDTGIYDRAKQQMPSVDFTVTLALEG